MSTRRRSSTAPAGVAALAAMVATAAAPFAAAPTASGQAPSGPVVHTNTEHVEALALAGGALWAATRGGLERYDLAAPADGGRGGPPARTRLYTTLDGLLEHALVDVRVDGAQLVVEGPGSRCTLGADDRPVCAWVARPYRPRIAPSRHLRGGRVTAEVVGPGGVRYVGTTAGLFAVGPSGETARLTPEGQICSNHVTDAVVHAGRTFLGAFRDGLCVAEGAGFRRLHAPFRMVNDLQSTGTFLYVASSEGLFRARDGERFVRAHARALPGGANGLAWDGRHLWVTTPASVHRLRLGAEGERSRAWWRPAGSTAVQDVAVHDGEAWVVTEDRGAVRVHAEGLEVHDRAAGLPSSWQLAVDVGADGTVWLGTLRHGLVRLDPETRRAERVPLPDPWLLRVRQDDAGLLVGTQGGAFVLRDGVVLPVPDVPDPRVHELAVLDGALWVATESGTLVTRLP